MATVATSTAGPVEDPQILRLEVSSANFVLDVQNETETRTSEPSGDLIYDRRGLDISPALQVNLIGSVYHPYFMEFRLSAEAGVSWEDEKREQPGAPNPNESRQDTNPLQHYHARIIFFKRKPYSLTLLGDKDIVRRDAVLGVSDRGRSPHGLPAGLHRDRHALYDVQRSRSFGQHLIYLHLRGFPAP